MKFIIFLIFFLLNSKNNKRFIETKLKRVKKLENFYLEFLEKTKYFYENMKILLNILSKIMNQKLDAKTIIFAIKMFSYWARNIFDFKKFSREINIPIDSRLEKLYKKYSFHSISFEEKKIIKNKEIKKFYSELSKKLDIPLLHLDAILWVNYEKLIK